MGLSFDNQEIIGIVLLAVAFFLVEGSHNKLILAGFFFFYMGIFELFNLKKNDKTKNISLYSGCINISLGLFSFGVAYLLPNYPNLFAILFGIIIFVEFIFLYFLGYSGTFKKIMFILFSLPLIWAVYSLFITFFSMGINGLKIPEIIIAILAILTFILIYWAFLSFFNKIFPQNKITCFLMSPKGISYSLLILALLIITGFLWKGISISLLEKTINKIPYIPSILTIIGFLSLFNWLFPKKEHRKS